MKIISTLISLTFLMGISTLSFADSYVPAHLCFKPERPLFISTIYQKEKYKNDVTTFKFCIREFVKNQERAMMIHQAAVKKATSDWNEFVQEEQ
ncbi:MAG: hypothetical protein HQL46_16015 [Gammaproteobacteria bacterium]|nr:hypothetical protein [Gammaproteobacteria bacterium]